jgi:N-methylhydantoinase A
VILGVDVGGTFTDAVLVHGRGLLTAKSPTTPGDQSEGVMAAVDRVLGQAGAEAGEVDRLVHGMTVGTNALLEGRVARTALLATEGFTDIEELRRQARPELYRLCHGHPEPLVPPHLRVAVPERCDPDGVVRALDTDLLRERLRELPEDTEAVAICLLWGFRHPEHERAAADAVAHELPGAHVSTSHDTAAIFREYERLATTVVDAALSPLMRDYLSRLAERTRAAGLPDPEVMLSSGGVADASAAAAHGSWTVLSGPAGGAVAAARAAGGGDAVGLDMGGTSCDVSLVQGGRVAVTGGREVGGRALALPMVDVHTVGAGGGSIAWRDAGGALRVGPRSAGADPGPACYGRGGAEPTVTDADLLLGRLDPAAPLAGGVELDPDAAERAVSALSRELGMTPAETAAGIVRVADAEMAAAVRVVTVERGVDPRELTLVAFGGAGPLHAAAVAEELGVRRVMAPLASGVLSALGLAVSERRRDLVESVLLTGEEITAERLATAVGALADRGRAELRAPRAEVRATYDLRYAGQAFELSIEGDPQPQPARLRADFDAAHAERYGYADDGALLELVTVRVAVALPSSEAPHAPAEPAERRGTRGVSFAGDVQEASLLGPGTAEAEGPAVLDLPGSALLVPPGWRARAGAEQVVMER